MVEEGDDADTLLNAPPPPPSPPSGSNVSGASGSATRATIETIIVLRGEEASRAAMFGRASAILCALGLVLQLGFVEPKNFFYPLMTVAMAGLGAVGAWVWYRARNPAKYTRLMFRVFVVVGLVAALVFQLYLGFFSSSSVVVALGISFFGLGDDSKFALRSLATGIAVYFLLGLLVAIGVLPDMGLMVPAGVTATSLVPNAIMVCAVYSITLWQARISRNATIEAIERSNEAARVAQRREAQLAEANQNLDVVLRAGAGKEGRYSGTRAGSYLLDRIIGRGAMGEVYAATHESSGRAAAVKLLHVSALEDTDIARRFFREAEIEMRLESAYVVKVYDVGEAVDGAPFIAMELLTGNDLAWHLRQKQMLSLAEVVILVDEVARGLEVAHAAGVVHRDLKPQNLFHAEGLPRAVWKIVDFGVSRVQGSTGTMTEGAILGTPGYMAPEQAQGERGDHRADIFSLGAVAYRALTGAPAFSGSAPPQVLYEIVFGSPVRPGDLLAGVPADVELVLAIALAKRDSDRFASAIQFADAFRAASRSALDPKLRRRARGLLAQLPWGRSSRDRDAATLPGHPPTRSGPVSP